ITVGPLTRLWRRARRQGVLPLEDAIRYWRSKTGFQHVKLHPHSQRLQWLTPGLQFDLGGIAQGFVVDAVAGYLRQQGISAFLVNASGDIVTQGSPPGAQDWKIAVNLPGQSHALHRKPLRLRTSGAVSTSGDALQYLEVNGNRYSHILDPVTGMGSTWQRNVTVLAQHATLADWLSTACSLLPVQEAFALAKSQQAGLLIGWVAAGNKIQWKANRLFKKYWKND
ncbi:MAG TPA: FAD:protein FMN transferase, partial [Phnomibacter sp.]|nr:FAD:protein FMN transferase [Phnomibacter sp.]